MGAFAIEMLLKTVQSHFYPDDSFEGGHSLVNSFNSIDCAATKSQLEKEFKAKTSREFQGFLNEQAQSFIQWRYFSESGTRPSPTIRPEEHV